jgi:hypothetical protein
MPKDVDDFLAAYDPAVRKIALKARKLILALIPKALEQVDPPSKIIAYGYDRTYKGLICALAPQKAYVNLMFAKGTQLPDPEKLLEGTGKKARHVKLKTMAEVEKPAVRALIETAVELQNQP